MLWVTMRADTSLIYAMNIRKAHVIIVVSAVGKLTLVKVRLPHNHLRLFGVKIWIP
jgi:hypothetical protein